MQKGFLLVAFVFVLNNCNTKHNHADSMTRLSNGTIEIGLLPEVGGRLVRVSLTGHPNIIQSDSALWNEPSSQRPSLNPLKPFKAYNGEINWVNPQSEWWVKQDSFPDLKANRTPWPPDPYLVYAPYKITDQNPFFFITARLLLALRVLIPMFSL